jgi:hypothetical protein
MRMFVQDATDDLLVNAIGSPIIPSRGNRALRSHPLLSPRRRSRADRR